jgi:hypothetical protein
MNQIALGGILAGFGEILASIVGALNPQLLLPSLAITFVVTIGINVTVNK